MNDHDPLTITAFCERTGIGRTTFYRHVANGYRVKYPRLNQTTVAHFCEWLSAQHAPDDAYPEITGPIITPPVSRSRYIPIAVRREVAKRDGNKCHYCNGVDSLTFDHKECFSKGGKHTVENVVLACYSCNIRKGTMAYGQFRAVADKRLPVIGGLPRRVEITMEQLAAAIARVPLPTLSFK